MTLSGNVAGTYVVTIDYFAGATDSLDVELEQLRGRLHGRGQPDGDSGQPGRDDRGARDGDVGLDGSRPDQAVPRCRRLHDGTTSLGRTLVNILP